MPRALLLVLLLLTSCMSAPAQDPAPRPRARAAGIVIGTLPRGPLDAITDVAGVRVGHATRREGERIRTGVTVVLPHGGNLFREKVPAAIHTMNGFGKLAGSTQVDALGELESPVALTNTLAVGTVLDALVGWTLAQPGNEQVRSVNAVVAETNDGRLNDIRARAVRAEHVLAALQDAREGAFATGAVGAGTGTVCLGWKGGIGTASRVASGYTVGVLAQTNFGGRLTIEGLPIDDLPRDAGDERGSCVLVLATDAPLCARNLGRLAARAFAGMARTGASFANGSGDYAIAFSVAPALRSVAGAGPLTGGPMLANDAMSPLFAAAAEAAEAAIVDSLCAAVTTTGCGVTVPALPVGEVLRRLRR